MQYQLLILRTYRHFSGRVWLAYDQAFREHATASRLTDWSSMNVQLLNFHSAGSSARGTSLVSSNDLPELPGSSSSVIHCKSCNKAHFARLHSHPAATLTSARCAQAFIRQSPALTSLPKNAVPNPNIAAILQVPQGPPLGLRLTVVEPISDCLPWPRIRGGFSCLVLCDCY